jgi:disulfide bond formation protein DsbB
MRRIGVLPGWMRRSLGRAPASGNGLRGRAKQGTSPGMTLPGIRGIALSSALAAAFALGLALASERWEGLVPCALCLLERWPYRAAIALGLLASVVPHRWARALLALIVLSMLISVALAVVHVGVEQHYWPSPLPECAAPSFTGGTIAERLAQMPTRPAKPCEDAAYLIPGLPISMAAMNLLYALAFAILLGILLWRGRRAA